MKKYIVMLFCFILIGTGLSLSVKGSNNDQQSANNEIIKQANQDYSRQDYAKAIELYKIVLGNGYVSFELYYNLGNAYFKTNQVPSSILYYEKAKKLNPSDEDLNFNLKVANTRIVDKIDVIPDLFIKTWSNNLVGFMNADGWAEITVVAFILFFVLMLLYLFSKTLILRQLSFWISIVLLFISISSYAFAKHQYNDLNKIKEAIVFTPTVSIKSSPDQNSIDLFVIHEGLKVRIIDQVNDWYNVRIANGSKGWLKISDVDII